MKTFLGGDWSRVIPPHSNIRDEKQFVLLAPTSNSLAYLG